MATRSTAAKTAPETSPPWWAHSATDVLIRLHTDRNNGLSEDEARRRVRQYGPNSLPEEEAESVWASLIEAFKDPLAVILTLAAVLSAAIGLARGETEDLKQGALSMGIVIFITLIGDFTDRSAENELETLKVLQTALAR